MIKLGTLDGVRNDLRSVQSILKSMGDSGTFEFKPSISETHELFLTKYISLKLQTPIKIDYEFQSTRLILKFEEPYPVGSYKVFSRQVTSVDVTLERINIGLAWSPDGYLEILS